MQDTTAASSQWFTSGLNSHGVFVHQYFVGYFISELSLPVNRVRFARGGCGVAAAWANGVIIQKLWRQGGFSLVKCFSGFCLLCIV